MGVLCGVGDCVGRRIGASAVLALWGCGGPWGGPADGPGIIAGGGSSVLLWIVAGAGGGPGSLAVVVAVICPAWAGPHTVRVAEVVAGPPLRLGCWRRCLVSSLAVIVAAGGHHVVGVLYPLGSLPQLHSRVYGCARTGFCGADAPRVTGTT